MLIETAEDFSELEIENIVKSDEGEYICVVKNDFGEDKCCVTLTVEGKSVRDRSLCLVPNLQVAVAIRRLRL